MLKTKVKSVRFVLRRDIENSQKPDMKIDINSFTGTNLLFDSEKLPEFLINCADGYPEIEKEYTLTNGDIFAMEDTVYEIRDNGFGTVTINEVNKVTGVGRIPAPANLINMLPHHYKRVLQIFRKHVEQKSFDILESYNGSEMIFENDYHKAEAFKYIQLISTIS